MASTQLNKPTTQSAAVSQTPPSYSSETTEAAVKRPNLVRRLYDWCLSWADSPYGTPALAMISFAESSFFPIPPDVLQIGLSVAKPKRSYFYAAINTLGSVLGAILGWCIGVWFWEVAGPLFFQYVPGFTAEKFQYVEGIYQKNAVTALLLAAFTPIPFKIFTVASGVFEVPLLTLIWASALGRSARFFLVGTVIYFFGPRVKVFIEKYLNILTIVLSVALVGGFVALKYLRH